MIARCAAAVLLSLKMLLVSGSALTATPIGKSTRALRLKLSALELLEEEAGSLELLTDEELDDELLDDELLDDELLEIGGLPGPELPLEPEPPQAANARRLAVRKNHLKVCINTPNFNFYRS